MASVDGPMLCVCVFFFFDIELIEQLPVITACSKYKSLNAQSSTSQTVRSGFLMAIAKESLQRNVVSNSLTTTHKRANPPRKTVNLNLPPHLMGDVFQVIYFYKSVIVAVLIIYQNRSVGVYIVCMSKKEYLTTNENA